MTSMKYEEVSWGDSMVDFSLLTKEIHAEKISAEHLVTFPSPFALVKGTEAWR